MREPLINAIAMEIVVAPRKNLQLLAVDELAEADAALGFLPRAAVGVRRRLVQDDGQPLDGRGVQTLRWQWRRRVARLGGVRRGWDGVAAVVAADPARVEEEDGDEKDNGEEYDDEEECPSSDLEVPVIELRVVPVQWPRIVLGRHGDWKPNQELRAVTRWR